MCETPMRPNLDSRSSVTIDGEGWGWSSHPRRVVETLVGPRVEFAFPCPVSCHGFGICNVCRDTGVVWRGPKPYPMF